jgi:signal transduction histidine kinase
MCSPPRVHLAESPHRETGHPSHMPKELLRKARILIVDDEPANVRLLERILEMSGTAAIRSTTDSRTTLTLCEEFHPDLILLDLNMPHMDGFAVMDGLSAFLDEKEYLPVLVLTADITPETKRRALAAGAKDFVTKPLDTSEVLLRIKNLLENRFLSLELRQQNDLLERQVRDRTQQVEETLDQLQSTQEAVVKQERLRALGMMAGGIAHDFNNALTMMLGYGELLVPWLKENGSERENTFLKHMVAAAQDATHIVSRLREFYRPAENNEIRVAVDLRSLAEQAVSLTSPKWKGKSRADGVQITVVSELAEVPAIAGSAAELREVLTNLIFNAVDAMPKGGAITVTTCATEDGRVLISVADTGTGMTEDERQRCLEPFFTTKGDGGTGLGLSVVYGIVQRHGGEIDIQSTKGCGTTFRITFPATTIAAVVADEQEEAVASALRVLVVDDQEIICELLAENLKADGHEASVATGALEALAAFKAAAFDLVITDQSMPEMNGLQLAEAIKELSPSTPIILLTGFGDEMQARGRLTGVDLVLGKPASASDLRRAVHQVCMHPEPGLEREQLACIA